MIFCCIHSCLQRSLAPFTLSFFFFLHLFVFFTITFKAIAFNLTTIRFDEGYSNLFSDFNIQRSSDDRTVSLLLNRLSGSGIISTDYYNYGFFSARIKLPSDYNTAGIVVAFYTSNVDTFERNHDELDFEFLGNVEGRPWRFQTNMYGNGSVSRGREERYRLWFDPSKESHRYSILWTPKNIIFYVDDIPIREVIRNDALRGDYPSKPMSVYATIWDGSTWATDGGKAKVNYIHEPFATEMKDLVLEGCRVDPIEQVPSTNCSDRNIILLEKPYSKITPERKQAMKEFREKYMFYSYCYDNLRYPVTPPECVIVDSERKLFQESGHLRKKMKFRGGHRKRRRGGSGGQGARQRRRNQPGTTSQQGEAAL